MNSRCAFSHAATLVLAILCVVALPTDASPQGTPRLVQPASLVKLGTFTLPAGLPGDGFEFGGTALSINPANNSLFVVGHDWHQLMAEVTIPPLGGTAVVLQALHDPSEGRSVGAGDTKIGGSLVYQGQLWFTKYIYYDGDASQTMSHFSRPLSLSTSGQLTGPQTIGTLGAGFVSGYLGRIPVEWQSALGGTVLTGNCCLSIISRTSYGPAVSAWTPGQSSAVPLVHYTGDHQTLGTYGAAGIHPDFNGTTRIKGIAFPEGTDSVLFFGRTGVGPYCYGEAAECGDPSNDYRGEHAYPYHLYVWAYNAYDLAAVRTGSRQPWEIVPYATWDLGIDGTSEFSSHTAYDPATQRIYVSQVGGNGDLPLIHVFSVRTPDTPPTLTVSPTVLRFAATRLGASGALQAVTGAQTVTVSVSGGTTGWTATADRSWVQITNGTGSGTGQFTVGIDKSGNGIGGPVDLSATMTITPRAGAARTVGVALTIDQTGGAGTQPPFGLVDTPLQNATGVVGTIGVTGWVLDDLGVANVKLYRNCLAFEPAANCVTVVGRPVVFVGDATLVTGARPDVEALYPTLPQASRAAWGYLLLTNLLPHTQNQQMFGGQGAMTFSALATDVEGKQVWLGRSMGDTTATTITLANDTIAKPFGAIDTPAQGATVSGTFANFGWALTPDANATVDAGDIVVPTDGSTLRVYLDGVPGATIAYNQCRGTTAAGPVPAGVWCNDDVASIFGHPTPQATFAARAANATKHRNLDVGRGAIGALLIDTTTLANGVHTIMWGVTDSAGRGEGLGSRYFTVLNAGADAPATPTPPAGDDGATPAYGVRPTAHGRTAGRADAFEDTPGLVRARTGLDLDAPLDVLPADDAGVRAVRIADLGRLEVHVGPVEAGYLVANGVMRDLPPGSYLDRETGVFTWAPGVGYFGTYRLVFVRAGQQIPVDVTIAPVPSTAPGESEIRMALDVPVSGATVSGALRVAGWALDPQAAFGSGIDAVHVWAQRTDVAGAEPQFLGAAALGGARPDVAAAYGPQFRAPAFDLTTSALSPGRYGVTAYVRSVRTARWEDARMVLITVR